MHLGRTRLHASCRKPASDIYHVHNYAITEGCTWRVVQVPFRRKLVFVRIKYEFSWSLGLYAGRTRWVGGSKVALIPCIFNNDARTADGKGMPLLGSVRPERLQHLPSVDG